MEDITEDPYEDSQRFESISIDPNQLYATSDSMALSISIESFQFIEDRMRRHVSYKIVGEDNGKKIEIYRRYKEFRLLYKILTQLWPGCLIPKLPKKKAVGNLKTNFIDKRKKLLELFLIKVCSQPYLSGSKPFVLFLTNPLYYAKIEKDIKVPSYADVSVSLQKYFSEYKYFAPSLEQKESLKDCLSELREHLEIVLRLKKLARASSLAFVRYEDSITGLMNGIKNITPIFLQNKSLDITHKESYINPYLSIRDWLRSDLIDIESLIEAINKCYQLEESSNQYEAKIQEKKKKIEDIQGGKISLSQRIMSKNHESLVSDEEKKLQDLELTKESLDKIIVIALGKLLQNDIPRFKQQKIYKVCVTMRNYSNTTAQEYQEIAEQILQIEEILFKQ